MVSSIESDVAICTFIVTGILSVAGFYFWFRLGRFGGLELSLAHIVANPRRLRVFFWTLTATIVFFVLAGVVEAVAIAMMRTDQWGDAASAGLFACAAAGILVLISNVLRSDPLTLSEELTLRGESPAVLKQVYARTNPRSSEPDEAMYVVPPPSGNSPPSPPPQ